MEDLETGPNAPKDLTGREQQASTSREVKPNQLELLLTPIKDEHVFSTEIASNIAYASLLGGIMNLGLDVSEDSYDYCLKIQNPSSQEPNVSSEVKFKDMVILDHTTNYSATLFAEKLDAPSPLAIVLPVGLRTIVNTTDSDNPSNAQVGIETRIPNGAARITFSHGKLSSIEISHIEEIEGKVFLVKSIALEPQSSILEVTNQLSTESPLIEEGLRLFKRVERYRRIDKDYAPRIVLAKERGLINLSVDKISSILGIDSKDKELDSLLDTLPDIDAGTILKKMMEKAGKSNEADKIINALKEGIPDVKQHGLSARFKIEDDQLILQDTYEWGNTNRLAPQWKENMLNFAKRREFDSLLPPLGGLVDELNDEFSNIAALVNGKINFPEDNPTP